MTDPDPTPDDEFGGIVPTVEYAERDPVLDVLLDVAEDGFGIAIGVHVGGVFVHGTPISERAYLEELDKQWVKSGSESPKLARLARNDDERAEDDRRRDRIRDAIADARKARDRERLNDLVRRLNASGLFYLHLRDIVTVGAGGGRTTYTGGFWRGRVDRIDGFMVGSLGEAVPDVG